MARWSEEMEAHWQQLAEEVVLGMKEWRLQNPKATFREIEAALTLERSYAVCPACGVGLFPPG